MTNEHEQQHEHEDDLDRESVVGADPPRIYVASLSDYNVGRLHGRWIAANQIPTDIEVEIGRMLEASPALHAEEYAIHDYDGFGAWRPGEFSSIETVSLVAEAIVEHGEAVTHWIDYLGDEPAMAVASFEDAYLGEHASMRDFAEQLAEDIGLTITVEPESWSSYVTLDVDGLARDLEIELYAAESSDGTVYVFDPNVDLGDGN